MRQPGKQGKRMYLKIWSLLNYKSQTNPNYYRFQSLSNTVGPITQEQLWYLIGRWDYRHTWYGILIILLSSYIYLSLDGSWEKLIWIEIFQNYKFDPFGQMSE